MNHSITEKRYSVFISFSGKDRKGWRSKFVDELKRGLPSDERERIYISEINPVVGGRLSAELQKTLDRSDFLVSIIGENYIKSKWCEVEIEWYFRKDVREKNIGRFVAVTLDEPTDLQLSTWDVWKNCELTDFARVPFFYSSGGFKGKPIFEVLDDAGVSQDNPKFAEKVQNVANYIVEKLQEGDPTAKPSRDLISDPGDSTQTYNHGESKPITLLIGVPTTRLTTKALGLAKELKESLTGLPCRVEQVSLSEITSDERNSNETSLFKRLADCTLFVLPVADETPELPVLGIGGLSGYQRRERLRATSNSDLTHAKKTLIAWSPNDIQVPDSERSSGNHKAFFDKLKPLETKGALDLARAIKDDLFPQISPPQSAGIAKLVIEDNEDEAISYESLERRLREIWNDIILKNEVIGGNTLSLVAQPISVSFMKKLGTALEPDGVISLWGSRPIDAAYSQAESVDRRCLRIPQKSRYISVLFHQIGDEVDGSFLNWPILRRSK